MRRKKVKKKSLIILIIIVLIILIEIINPIKLYNKHKLRDLNYNDTSINKILKNDLKDEILSLKYSKALDSILASNYFDIKNFDIYKKLIYYDIDEYAKNVNLLIKKGYTSEEINNILKCSNDNSLKEFLKKDYIENISKFLKYDFSILGNYDRYVSYQNKHNIDTELVVIYVNIGLDKEFYQDTKITDKFSKTMLVNKYNGVSENFVPDSLVDVPDEYSSDNEKLNEEALKAFIKMSDDCKVSTGYKLLVKSGYRDFKKQEETYNSYLKLYGKKYAENYVTHPGYSEHHTGLAIDVKAESSNVFIDSKESSWTYKNAYKYGFILRYKKEYENITGIKYESWHFRYVGEEIAKQVTEQNITYEEYYLRNLSK